MCISHGLKLPEGAKVIVMVRTMCDKIRKIVKSAFVDYLHVLNCAYLNISVVCSNSFFAGQEIKAD